MKTKITCAEVLNLIPDELISNLEEETGVNYGVKKIKGGSLFKILLFSLLESERISLRVIEELYNSAYFKTLSGDNDNRKIKYNSLSDRLCNIDYVFFEKIFEQVYQRAEKLYGAELLRMKYNIVRFDSTFIHLSSNLLKIGMSAGGEKTQKRQIKCTVGLKGVIPQSIKMFKEQREISEEIALKKVILDSGIDKDGIIVFDRGLQRRQTFGLFDNKDMHFVTRLKSRVRYKHIREFKKVRGRNTNTLILEQDIIVQLKDENEKYMKKEFRLIESRSKKTDEKLYFLTNITALSAKEITEIYKKRWDIEVFFRFIKQELNFKHFLSRSENGIKVMLYMTLILATLLLIYKKINKISGYKISKLRFTLELEMEIIKDIVLMCNGDISQLKKLGYCDSS